MTFFPVPGQKIVTKIGRRVVPHSMNVVSTLGIVDFNEEAGSRYAHIKCIGRFIGFDESKI